MIYSKKKKKLKNKNLISSDKSYITIPQFLYIKLNNIMINLNQLISLMKTKP